MSAIEIDTCFWLKLSFMVFVFFEALLSGWFPTFNRTCRESPKILGIANSFAAGVFLAIAFIHILPEEVENWNNVVYENKLAKGGDTEKEPFPLPYVLVFCGYTLILIIDKVMFDTHLLFDADHHEEGLPNADPAAIKLAQNVR